MKRILALILAAVMIAGVMPASAFTAETEASEKLGWGLEHIYATFLGETVDVKRNVMEIDGGMAEPVTLKIEHEKYVDLAFSLFQMIGNEIYEIGTSEDGTFRFLADETKPEWPFYVNVLSGDTHEYLGSDMLALRVNPSTILGKVPENISSEFGSGFMVDMSDLLPGMELDVLPFLIPITAKTYADGRLRLGLGVNSSDVEFWKKAGNGEMPEDKLVSDMKELLYGDPKKLNDIQGKSMGLIVIFSGWAEGNLNTDDPIKGHMQLFIGTGFDITGQYSVITWEITLMGGAEGIFDFSYNLLEEDGKYHFSADEIRLGVKGSLEVYGGIGISLASVGAYGLGSIQYQSTIYPDAEMEHLILSGEVGLKAKLFGKVICCFKIVSGSHDFVNKKKPKAFLAMGLGAEETKEYLLSGNYGGQVGVLSEPGGTVRWYGTGVEEPTVSNDANGTGDNSHLLASYIYPDNHVQIVSVGDSSRAMMNIAFLGYDSSRGEGNRSVLMASLYDIGTGNIPEPKPVADDGTADFDPCLYGSPKGYSYLVWRNAQEAVTADMTFSEIADRVDIAFAEYRDGVWSPAERVTDLAGSGRYAAGARVSAGADGAPVVVYYTGDTGDPAGLSGTHEIFTARRTGSGWVSEKITEVSGMITGLDCSRFPKTDCVGVSWEENGTKKAALWQDGSCVWNRENASRGRFIGAGYDAAVFSWYEDGRIRIRSSSGSDSYLTPADIQIPDTDYEIYGRMMSSSLMITGMSSQDGTSNAFAFVSQNGGQTWGRSELTDLREYALVSHISAAFTPENEPVLIYCVQNYRINADIDRLLSDPLSAEGEGSAGILLGQDDERFTDTRADLYIKVRKANSHIRFVDGKPIDIETNAPGKTARFLLTVKNTGLYPIDKAAVVCGIAPAGVLSGTIRPGETAQIPVQAELPAGSLTETVSFTFEISSREDAVIEDSITVPADPGYLQLKATHMFEFRNEKLRYEIRNLGYTDKEARILVRDEKRDVTLEEKTVLLKAASRQSFEYDPAGKIFRDDLCEDVTVYVLMKGEEPGDAGISANRVKSIRTLPELFGQPMPGAKEIENPPGHRESSGVPAWVWPAAAGSAVFLAGAVTAVVLIRRKRKQRG